jgi:alpha-beta hydrolase superfamily lysophospholipase
MTTSRNVDYSALDRPEVLMALFHPRPDAGTIGGADTGLDLLIPVEENIRVGARFHIRDNACPNILFFHAEYDHIIPFSDGQSLYDASPAPDKKLIRIPGANHNDILFRGLHEYMDGIQKLVGCVANE